MTDAFDPPPDGLTVRRVRHGEAFGEAPQLSSAQRGWRGFVVELHRHPAGAFERKVFADDVLIVSLAATVTVEQAKDNRTHKAVFTSGDLTLCPAGAEISERWEGPDEWLSISFEPDFLARVANEAGGGRVSATLTPAFQYRDPFVETIAAGLLAELRAPAWGSRLLAEAHGTALAVHLLRTRQDGAAKLNAHALPPVRLRRVKDFVEAHLQDDIGISDLADIAGVSLHHFAREFRRSEGMPPYRFITERRIARAKHLMESTDLPLIDIAFRCGFSSQSQFTETFQKIVGTTPARWRRSRAV